MTSKLSRTSPIDKNFTRVAAIVKEEIQKAFGKLSILGEPFEVGRHFKGVDEITQIGIRIKVDGKEETYVSPELTDDTFEDIDGPAEQQKLREQLRNDLNRSLGKLRRESGHRDRIGF